MNPQIPVKMIDPAPPAAIHTRSFRGRWRTLRLWLGGGLFALFFGTAWLDFNGHQAVLWDVAQRKFHIFGATFWPQDFILLSILLILCAFALFTATMAAGRLWCGYLCPQSSWTWLFMWAERVTEGDRSQRIKLDAAPWSASKLLRRSARYSLWLLISLATGLTFTGYFTPIRPLAEELLTLQWDSAAMFWVFTVAAMTWMNAGHLREKVCRDMCPYSRFQGVMFDADTLVIAYDSARGEPRGQRRRDSDHRAAGLGDCVDCTLCVQVCPTGIDIRDGLQLECIGCAACIDACDSVMDRLGYARGLVRYSSERELAGGHTRWLRPRLVGYAVALLLMVAAFGWAVWQRPLVSLDVTRDRNLFRENAAGQIENTYRLKVINKTQQPHSYRISLNDSGPFLLQGKAELQLEPGEIRDVPLSLTFTGEHAASTSVPVSFRVQELERPQVQVNTVSTFVSPVGR